MTIYPVDDWDDAYSNGAYIPGSDAYPQMWAREAAAFRAHMREAERATLSIAYGADPRERYDLFLPERPSNGAVVFVHGGYWKSFDRSDWSHLAAGALAHGFAVAIPSYPLAPGARIAEIVHSVAKAVEHVAANIDGPIHLAGHSAGGHLVSRLVARPSPLSAEILDRVVATLSISGVHDLRPLRMTTMNETLRLDEDEARNESPALLAPVAGIAHIAWVGAEERPEFLRQNRLIGMLWDGVGALTSVIEERQRHHFNVIEGLRNPNHPMVAKLLCLT